MKIGYTTGVFDLFHIGHLNILKKAKENCDYLIVGVSTDELVVDYKNRKPIISVDDRIEIISNIKCVDKVVKQTEFNKIIAYENLKFNILFHGDDWKDNPKYIEIESALKDKGVEIKYFEYTKDVSTSIIKNKILEILKVLE